MIQLRNVYKIFETENIRTTALNNINLDIMEHDFIALMGESGSGKSTLASILSLLDTPSSGEFSIEGVSYSALPESELVKQRRGKVGIIFQSFHLIDTLRVRENVELPLIYLNIDRKDRAPQVAAAIESVNLQNRLNHFPYQLSGGQKQRVAIARALVTRPKFIVADEPTGNLDTKSGAIVMELLANLNATGSTIIIVTHSQRDATYAKKILRMEDGCLTGMKRGELVDVD